MNVCKICIGCDYGRVHSFVLYQMNEDHHFFSPKRIENKEETCDCGFEMRL